MTYSRINHVEGLHPGSHQWSDWREAIDHPKWVWGPFFHPSEFKSLKDPEPQLIVDHAFMSKLYMLRVAWKKPIHINSGYRSKTYNGIVGGSPNSYHMQGRAIDVHFGEIGNAEQAIANRLKFIALATIVGFRGFGWYDTFIHIDSRLGLGTWND